MESPLGKTKFKIWTVEKNKIRSRTDRLTVEEPLEIRLVSPEKKLAVTMRTPGCDFDLVAGFLYSEGIIDRLEDISQITYCTDKNLDREQQYNIVNVRLKETSIANLPSLERHFFTTSACGVCGKASIDALKIRDRPKISATRSVSCETIYRLSDRLRSAQGIFSATGGLHAAALFDLEGNLLKLREDVGRHNALDKLIGSALLSGELPLSDRIVLVSGRSSFEILQKCIVAGVPILCAISAPSSLAVTLAREFDLTLIGFLRGERFNVYAGIERISVI